MENRFSSKWQKKTERIAWNYELKVKSKEEKAALIMDYNLEIIFFRFICGARIHIKYIHTPYTLNRSGGSILLASFHTSFNSNAIKQQQQQRQHSNSYSITFNNNNNSGQLGVFEK